MKTSELTGAALDWAVAKCEYPDLVWGSNIGIHYITHQIIIPRLPERQCYWNPSTEWALGGPIIEREKISIDRETLANQWLACPYGTRTARSGPTPLIAAMRCYVASKLGDTVELPEELK
jgi:hypothetical protein